ncbi:ORF6C domain-containing protein [Enterococcus faecalis]|uniref:Rha family transcriptional regulator n=1 Tax=Enterococcus faecalis TaxID=1351 RepID=UPI0018E7FC10|nr:ORF6C domain-containing protein [Enterococcus faecalis]MBJ1692750.1 ORF6C domain-containing protein [Enterococcus faecalis]
MENLVIMKNQEAVTTSLQVAETFNKNHRDVLAAIDDLKEGVAENYADLFYEDSYIHPQNKQKYRQIIMNRDGFTLLAMGFTGQKALKFKLKYIEAFNQMEELLKTQSNLPINNTELLLEAALKHERGLTLVNQRLDKLETETTINRSQQRKIQGLVSSTVIKVLGGKKTSAYKDSSIKQSAFSNCYKQLKALFDVASYVDIPKVRYEEALTLILKWKPDLELQARIDMANGNGDMFKEVS